METRDFTTCLNQEERGLLLQLLQVELRELPVEIHHSRNSQTRVELQHRREVATALLERLQRDPVSV